MSDKSLTIGKDRSARLSAERVGVCLQAVWEIDALAKTLPRLIPNTDETEGLHLTVRGIAARILQLNNAVLAGLGDDLAELGRLQKTVTLEYPQTGGEDE